MMTVAAGDRIPSETLFYLKKEGPTAVSSHDFFAGKKAILIAVPGPFTPICHEQHLPGYIEKAKDFFAKGVDVMACLAVNDAFVMAAWGKALGVGDRITMLSDGTGAFTRAMGATLDLSVIGLGVRSNRYVLYAEDGVIQVIRDEGNHEMNVSSASDFLNTLPY